MKISSTLKIISLLLLGIFMLITSSDFGKPIRYNINKKLTKYTIKKTEQENIAYDAKNDSNLKVKKAVFDRNGIDNIALISMVKDEEDIIFDNLVWHFCIGFRKFVIIDNNSTDKTRFLVEKFRDQVANMATVIIVDDPIVEYIQSEVTTGAMRLANSIWPKVDWIFPVDADEFWYPTNKLRDILAKIPDDKDVISIQVYNHHAIKDAENLESSIPFYDSLNFRLKNLSPDSDKVAVRATPDIVINQGNHKARSIEYYRSIGYIAGNTVGLDMRHFAIRSASQVITKYHNVSKANMLKLNLLPEDNTTHWTEFETEIKEKGLTQAGIDRFNNYVRSKEDCIQDPLPMPEALQLFDELTAK